jgi:predicted acylesterase/phospholipase RssA
MQDTKRIECDAVNVFIGTSIGAIISYFLAIGYTPTELVVWICSHKVFESLSMNHFDGIVKGDGVYNYAILHDAYEEMTREKMEFIPTLRGVKERFGKELVMCTYNFTKKRKEYISWRTHPELSCLDAMRMSSNLPFIFSPFWYNGDEYIDGGIVENFSFTSIPRLLSDPNISSADVADVENVENVENVVNVTITVKGIDKSGVCGICMDNDNDPNDRHVDDDKKYNKLTAILDRIYDLMMVPISEYEKVMIEKYRESIELITIHVKDLKIYTFQLPQSEKLELFSCGYTKTKEHFMKC